jgi:hypothetical protein
MKKNYIQPSLEVTALNAAYTICAESVFGDFNMGGGTTAIDPETGGI